MLQVDISIIVPVFNRQDFLFYTINSIINQTYNNWELLLVDDGSTDKSAEIAQNYSLQDKRVKFIERGTLPKGASTCRNIGIQQAKGNYIIFLDSDDLLAPYCLERRLQYIKTKPGLDFWVFPMLLFKEKPDDMRILHNIKTSENDLDRFLQRENVWLMSSPIWNKSSLKKTGGFNENYTSYQDWDLNTRALIMGLKYHFFDNAVPDNFYRQHNGTTISQKRYTHEHNSSNAKMIINTFILLKEHQKENQLRRKSLAGFFTDVLLRFRFEPQPHLLFSEVKTLLNAAIISGLVGATEAKIIYLYYKTHTFKLAYRSKLYRKIVNFIGKTIFLRSFYPYHPSSRLKHSYNGKIA